MSLNSKLLIKQVSVFLKGVISTERILRSIVAENKFVYGIVTSENILRSNTIRDI